MRTFVALDINLFAMGRFMVSDISLWSTCPRAGILDKRNQLVSAGTASAVEDARVMGVRVEVEDGESIGKAMRRLRKAIRYQLGWKAALNGPTHFIPQTEVRRKKAWKKLVMSQRETRTGKRQDRP